MSERFEHAGVTWETAPAVSEAQASAFYGQVGFAPEDLTAGERVERGLPSKLASTTVNFVAIRDGAPVAWLQLGATLSGETGRAYTSPSLLAVRLLALDEPELVRAAAEIADAVAQISRLQLCVPQVERQGESGQPLAEHFSAREVVDLYRDAHDDELIAAATDYPVIDVLGLGELQGSSTLEADARAVCDSAAHRLFA